LASGKLMALGNAVIRIRNPIAPPVVIHRDDSGKATATRIDGVKTFAAGHLADDEGVTVEAKGPFILLRWARNHFE
jgi:hypothetical protein